MIKKYLDTEPCKSCYGPDKYGNTGCAIECDASENYIEMCRKSNISLRNWEAQRSEKRRNEIMSSLAKVIDLLSTEFERNKNFPGSRNC